MILRYIPFLALTVLPLAVHAQGQVFFANHVLMPPPYVIDGLTGDRLTGTQYGAQLYYGASASSLTAHTAAPTRFVAAGSSRAGTWGIGPVPGWGRRLTGGGWGIPVWMQVRVWNVDQFPTYEAAVAGGGIYGSSTVFQYIQRLSTPPATTDLYMISAFGLPLFESFATVPEPGVALLALGAGIVFWSYRRRFV